MIWVQLSLEFNYVEVITMVMYVQIAGVSGIKSRAEAKPI